MRKFYCICWMIASFNCVAAQGISQKIDNYLSRKRTFNGSALVVYKNNILLYKGYGYKNALDKKQAVIDIIGMSDPMQFLLASKYDGKMKK